MPAQVDPAAVAWRLVWPRQPATGGAGTRLGRAAGSSLEFMDHRDYVPGDDLRHVDWRAYARTDQLRVRLFREEVAPALDVVVDDSPSMRVTATKAEALAALRDAFAHWGERGGARPRVHETQDLVPTTPLRRDGVRVVLSDFLFPHDPAPGLVRLAVGAALLVVVQVLDPWELTPQAEGAVALVDCETDQRVEIVLDEAAIGRYRQRLARLRAAVEQATHRVGGRFATVTAGPLAAMCRTGLSTAGIVEVA